VQYNGRFKGILVKCNFATNKKNNEIETNYSAIIITLKNY